MFYTYVAVAVFAAIGAGTATWKVQDWRYASKEKERLEAIERDRRISEKRVDTAAEKHEKDKTAIRTVYRTIEKEVPHVVEKPIYRNVCLDADGMRLVERALNPAPATGEPARAVPGPRRPD